MFNENIIKEFRDNKGIVSGPFEGMKLLLLTSKGAKSGQPRTVPLAYTMDGDNYVVAASKGGADTNPDWYFNLAADSHVTVEVGAEKFEADAVEADPEQRDQLYAKHAAAYPQFLDYERKTTRKIPVFILRRV